MNQEVRQITTFRSKKELAYDSLHTAILQGDLEPGARLVIAELTAELGISQIPVREALQQLQAEGFVTIEPHVGAKVTKIDADSICDVFDLLEALEVISTRAACQRMTEGDLDEMENLLREMDALVDDPDLFSQENAHLHLFICDQAGTPLVKRLLNTVLDHWDRLRRYYLTGVFARRVGLAQEEHWRIFEALCTKDPDRVKEVIHEHNRAARVAYTEYLGATVENC